jgi:hypothetical protein
MSLRLLSGVYQCTFAMLSIAVYRALKNKASEQCQASDAYSITHSSYSLLHTRPSLSSKLSLQSKELEKSTADLLRISLY